MLDTFSLVTNGLKDLVIDSYFDPLSRKSMEPQKHQIFLRSLNYEQYLFFYDKWVSNEVWSTYVCATVSHLYGFGLMDAEAMVREAERWNQVPPQNICVENADRQIR